MKVSVVIPIHNGLQYIEQCLSSIKNQEINNVDIEILLIDDASTDGLEKKIDFIKNKLDLQNLIYIRNDKNKKTAETRNIGIKKASGDYIAFLDADDWWEKDKLKKQIELIEKTGAKFVYTARKNVYNDREKTLTCLEKVNFNDILINNHITCSSVLIKSEISKTNLMSHPELGEDYINWLQILQKIPYAYGINEPLVNYRVQSGTLSSNKLKQLIRRWKIMKLFKIPFLKRILYLFTYSFTGLLKYI